MIPNTPFSADDLVELHGLMSEATRAWMNTTLAEAADGTKLAIRVDFGKYGELRPQRSVAQSSHSSPAEIHGLAAEKWQDPMRFPLLTNLIEDEGEERQDMLICVTLIGPEDPEQARKQGEDLNDICTKVYKDWMAANKVKT